MSKSKRSSESPPEFFADRCLGRRAPALLTEWGWTVHVIGDHFADDAQDIGDDEWTEFGLVRGWSLLTQDERISTQSVVRELLERYKGCVHCLNSANLAAAAKAARFDSHRQVIHQHVRDGRVGFFVVHEFGHPKRKRMG